MDETEGEQEDGPPLEPGTVGEDKKEDLNETVDLQSDEEVEMHTRGEPGSILAQPDPCPEIEEAIKRSVRQAHKNLGHPHRDTFVRMLRLGGAKAEAVTYAKQWQCPVCLQSAAPKIQRPAMTRQQGVYDFNDTVAADLLTVHDVDGVAYEVLSLVCWGSRYHVAKVLKTKSSISVAKKFLRYWVNWAGATKRLHYGRGGEFEGKFETVLERLNIESYVVPTDAAWQAGLGERHGGILKTMHRAIVHETSARGYEEMEITLLEAALAKNQLIKRHGFSPIQHVLGQDIRLPASVLAAPDELSAHSAAEHDGTFQRHLAIRQAARMAWARLDNSSRVRRAMLSKTRAPRGPWLPGSQVYFWRRAGLSKKKNFKGRVRQDPDRWIGPGVVLAVEGSRAVWISYRAKLMKVAPEHVRDATAEETFAQEFVLEELSEQMMNVQAPSAQTGFYDLRTRRFARGQRSTHADQDRSGPRRSGNRTGRFGVHARCVTTPRGTAAGRGGRGATDGAV
jgi:hypothetical protein